jgi:hypothetical protein
MSNPSSWPTPRARTRDARGLGGRLPWRPGGRIEAAHRPGRHNPHRRWLQPLFHQQCWCWGEDIRRPEGNLLLARGFIRERGARSSRYHLAEAGVCITLWAFGACFGDADAGGVFIDRHSLRLKLGPMVPPDAWSAAALRGYHSPRTAREVSQAGALSARFASWVADYEEWVPTVTHPGYRTEVLSRWDAAVVPARAMATKWRTAMTSATLPRVRTIPTALPGADHAGSSYLPRGRRPQ